MKFLMVCLGNICRSPLAEGILAEKVKDMDIFVDSAGTAAYHIDEAPDHRSIKIARKYGVNISKLRGRQFSSDDFENFDKIYVMDQSNYDNVVSLAINDDDKQKVDFILNESSPNQDLEVPDPYYGGDQGFENVYNMLDEATEVIVTKIKDGRY